MNAEQQQQPQRQVMTPAEYNETIAYFAQQVVALQRHLGDALQALRAHQETLHKLADENRQAKDQLQVAHSQADADSRLRVLVSQLAGGLVKAYKGRPLPKWAADMIEQSKGAV